MKAVFNDMQDHSSSLDGTTVRNQEELFAVIDSAEIRQPFVCELIAENGYKLTIGIGKGIGFVQHSAADGEIPYFMAVSNEKVVEQECFEFFVGDTPTPIPQRYCHSLETVKLIAAHFIETGARSPIVSWEEI